MKLTSLLNFIFTLKTTHSAWIPIANRDATSYITTNGTENEGFRFGITADCQLGKFAHKIEQDDTQKWYLDTEMLNAGMNGLNHFRDLRFIILIGDMVQDKPKYSSSSSGKTNDNNAQIETAKNSLSKTDIPVFVIPGNRDLGNEWNAPVGQPMLPIEQYQGKWGDDYYSFQVGSVMFLSLNTQIWKLDDETYEPAVSLFLDEFNWYESQMNSAIKDSSVSNIVIFMHIPPYYHYAAEADEDRNLPVTNQAVVNAGFDGACRTRFLDALPETKPFQIFSGHLHVNRNPDVGDPLHDKLQITSAFTMTKEDGNPDNKWRTGLGGIRLAQQNTQLKTVEHEWQYLQDLPGLYPN